MKLAGLTMPCKDSERLAVAAKLLHMQGEIPGAVEAAHDILSEVVATGWVLRQIHRSVHLRVLLIMLREGSVPQYEGYMPDLDFRPFLWHEAS